MLNFNDIANVCEQAAPIISALAKCISSDANPVHMSNASLGTLAPIGNVAEMAAQTASMPDAQSIVGGITEAKVGPTGFSPYAIRPGALTELAGHLSGGLMAKRASFGLAA